MLKERLEKFFNYYAEKRPYKIKDNELKGLDTFVEEFKRVKQPLYTLLGNQLVYKIPVNFDMSEETIANVIDNNEKYSDYVLDINSKINENFSPEVANKIYNFFNTPEYFATNIYTGPEFYVGKTKIKKGCKTLKHAQIILEYIKYASIADFMEYMSKFRNYNNVSGNLCISIDPIDFLTASTNKCGWTSCYDPFDNGYYSNALMQYMFNENCVIAYLESKRPMMLGDLECSNKKWREFFYIDADVISEIVAYPYKHNDLTKTVLNTLKDLARKNWGISYSDKMYLYNHGVTDESPVEVVPFFGKDSSFYEDDYTDNAHYCYIDGSYKSYIDPITREEKECINVIILDFANYTVCPYCGEIVIHKRINSSLVCSDCSTDVKCECCGMPTSNKLAKKIDGKYYCMDCLTDESLEFCEYVLDDYTKEPIKREDMVYVEVAADEQFMSFLSFKTNKNNLKYLLNPNAEIKKTNKYKTNYVYYDELTDEGKEVAFSYYKDLLKPPACEYDFLEYTYVTISGERHFIEIIDM